MDVKEIPVGDLDIKSGEKDEISEIFDKGNLKNKDDESEKENKQDTTENNCKEGGDEKKDPVSIEDKEITNKNDIGDKEEAESQNEYVSSEVESKKNEISSEFVEKGIQTEAKETQTEQQKNKDDCSPTLMDVLFNNLLQEIECPVCFEYMVPPITLCNNGHNICGTCVEDMDECPTCRGDLTNVKNRYAETLSRSITHPCMYRKSGCTGQFVVDSKEEHERICRYGPHKCPFNSLSLTACQWEGPMPEMKKHIEDIHNNSLVHLIRGKQKTYLENYMKYINFKVWYQSVFTMDNIFFHHSKIINNLLVICYMFVGSREDTNRFKYSVTIKTPDGKKNISSCFDCPNYLDLNKGDFPNQNSAAFYLDFTKLCVNEEGQLPIEYKITKH